MRELESCCVCSLPGREDCGGQGCWEAQLCCLLGSELRGPERLAPAPSLALQEA